MKNECPQTRDLCKELRQLGASVYVAVGGIYSRPGWPDRWIGHRKWCGWIEFKREGEVPRPAQVICLSEIERAGGYCAVVTFPKTVECCGRTFEWDGTAFHLLQILESTTDR